MKSTMLAISFAAIIGSFANAAVTHFVTMGDVPYKMPADDSRFVSLIAQTNALKPDFSVHVGDIKAGSTPCTDASITHIFDLFQTFSAPLIYTPGDNEWTDCHSSGEDPIERLAFVRKVFFSTNSSLGSPALPLQRQSGLAGYTKYVENARWSTNRVTYLTLHAVGSNNNLRPDNADSVAEFNERNAADLAWLKDSFAAAAADGSVALVIFMQADPQFAEQPDLRTGFNDLLATFADLSAQFARPVLLVHGDKHTFHFDNPLLDATGHSVSNFKRLEVPGSPFVQSVLVTVDPGASIPFSVQLQAPF